jgi:DNA-directed RNA polymerase subunit L
VKVNVISKTKKAMDIEFEDEDDTLLNLIKTNLLKDKAVVKAYYRAENPFTQKIVLSFDVKGDEAEAVLKRTLASIKKEMVDFKKQIEKLK